MNNKLITIENFIDMYSIKRETVIAFLKRHPCLRVDKNKQIYIDFETLIRRKEFQWKLWHFSTTIYYPLIEIFETEWELSKRLAMDTKHSSRSWQLFMRERLFLVPPEDITNLKISQQRLVFSTKGAKLLHLFLKKNLKSKKCI